MRVQLRSMLYRMGNSRLCELVCIAWKSVVNATGNHKEPVHQISTFSVNYVVGADNDDPRRDQLSDRGWPRAVLRMPERGAMEGTGNTAWHTAAIQWCNSTSVKISAWWTSFGGRGQTFEWGHGPSPPPPLEPPVGWPKASRAVISRSTCDRWH